MPKPYTLATPDRPQMAPDAFQMLAGRVATASYSGPVGVKQAMIVEHAPKTLITRTDKEPFDHDPAAIAHWFREAASVSTTAIALRADRCEFQPWRYQADFIWKKLDQFLAEYLNRPQGRIALFAVEERSWMQQATKTTRKVSFGWTSAIWFENPRDAVTLRLSLPD